MCWMVLLKNIDWFVWKGDSCKQDLPGIIMTIKVFEQICGIHSCCCRPKESKNQLGTLAFTRSHRAAKTTSKMTLVF